MNREVRTITPAIAEAWLLRNTNNRHVRPSVVAHYAAQMASGLWLLNGDAIRFDVNGELLDGQHRLAACVKAGHAFTSYVIEGLPPETRATIDVGAKRTAADFLTASGYPPGPQLAAAARLAYLYDIGAPFTPDVVPNQLLLDWLQKHSDLLEHLGTGQRVYRALGWSAAAWTAASYLFAQADKEQAAEFMRKLEFGDGLAVHDPALTLRNHVVKARKEAGRGSVALPARYQLAFIIKAWNANWKSEPMKLLRWNASESYPEVLGYPDQFGWLAQ